MLDDLECGHKFVPVCVHRSLKTFGEEIGAVGIIPVEIKTGVPHDASKKPVPPAVIKKPASSVEEGKEEDFRHTRIQQVAGNEAHVTAAYRLCVRFLKPVGFLGADKFALAAAIVLHIVPAQYRRRGEERHFALADFAGHEGSTVLGAHRQLSTRVAITPVAAMRKSTWCSDWCHKDSAVR